MISIIPILGPKNFYEGVTSQILSSRAIIAVMTNEHFSAETVGNATATIKWDIVSPPERYFSLGSKNCFWVRS